MHVCNLEGKVVVKKNVWGEVRSVLMVNDQPGYKGENVD